MPTDLPSDKNYFDWYQKLLENGTLSELMISYYEDSDSVYKARVEGEEFEYSIGTHPQLLHPFFTMDGVTYDKSLDRQENEDMDLVTRVAQQLANSKTDSLEVDDVEEYIWNNESYVVSETNIDLRDSSAELKLTNSSFYTTVTQEQKFINEIMSAILDSHLIGSTTIVENDVFESDFPLRERYMSSIVDRVKNSGEYMQGIGGTYVTLIQSNGEYYLLLGHRTDDVYVWPDRYTVFPDGLIQPTEIATGTILRDHLLHKYATEFYGIENPTLASRPVSSLNQLLNSEDATFNVTGAGVELVRGTFQVSGLLLIEYSDYISFMQEHSESSFQHDNISLVKLNELDEMITSLINPLNITPTSAFSLLNALNYIDENTDIEQPVDVDVKQYIPDKTPRFESDNDGTVNLDIDW